MIITVGSTLNTPCTHITIQSIGDSKHVEDGAYERFIFGIYLFLSNDARGNNVYHANMSGTDMFIRKDTENYWVVSITILHIPNSIMGNFKKCNDIHKTLVTSIHL